VRLDRTFSDKTAKPAIHSLDSDPVAVPFPGEQSGQRQKQHKGEHGYLDGQHGPVFS
jgi:hypothetical protein